MLEEDRVKCHNKDKRSAVFFFFKCFLFLSPPRFLLCQKWKFYGVIILNYHVCNGETNVRKRLLGVKAGAQDV